MSLKWKIIIGGWIGIGMADILISTFGHSSFSLQAYMFWAVGILIYDYWKSHK